MYAKRGIKHLFNGSFVAFYQYNYRIFQIYSALECWLAPFYQSGMLIFVWLNLDDDYNNKFNIKLDINLKKTKQWLFEYLGIDHKT